MIPTKPQLSHWEPRISYVRFQRQSFNEQDWTFWKHKVLWKMMDWKLENNLVNVNNSKTISLSNYLPMQNGNADAARRMVKNGLPRQLLSSETNFEGCPSKFWPKQGSVMFFPFMKKIRLKCRLGKKRCRLGKKRWVIVNAPQHAPEVHLRCAVIVHLKHNYSAPHFLG